MMVKFRLVAWLAAGALFCLGCQGGDDREPTFAVTGTVTHKGTPVEGAAVTFVPAGEGQTASGVTDASGKYSLTTFAKDDGALPGQYKVKIEKYNSPGETTTPAGGVATEEELNQYPEGYNPEAQAAAPPSKNLLPQKYADPDRSGLSATVQENPDNKFDFALEG